MVSKGSDTTNEIEHEYWDFYIGTLVNANNAEQVNQYDLFPGTLVNRIENLNGIQDIVYSQGGCGEVLLEEKALELRLEDYFKDRYLYRAPFVVQKLDDEYLAELKELARKEELYLDVDRVIQGEGVILLHLHLLSHAQIEKNKDTIGMPVGIYSLDNGKKTRDMEFCGYLDLEANGLPRLEHTWIGESILYFLTSEKDFENMGIKEQMFSIGINAKPVSKTMLYNDLENIMTDYNRQFEPDDEGKLKDQADEFCVLDTVFKIDVLMP
ncbi:MAG: hypothetical protein K2K09_05785 [Lachnospiraceae bacterium]|nr:hypothetical protein [Lachnospiraceae bacterium]